MRDPKAPPPRSQPITPWTVTSSEHLVDDRWLKLRADHCLTAEGVEIAPYYVMEYPDWVQIVALDDQGQVVLVEQYRHGVGLNLLELPAGAVDPDDADALATGARELMEETGYTSDDWRYIARLSPNPASHTNYCHVVLATNARPTHQPIDDPAERLNLIRMPVDEVVQLAASGGIVQAMHVAALCLALGPLGLWRP